MNVIVIYMEMSLGAIMGNRWQFFLFINLIKNVLTESVLSYASSVLNISHCAQVEVCYGKLTVYSQVPSSISE